MVIENGDIKNPTGNAIIYWRIRGNNKLVGKSEIIASNIVISPLQYNNETLMVNFPPVLIENYEQLLKIAEINNIDLIPGGSIYVPEDITDFNNFYKKQIEKYNGIIQEYLLAYKEKNSLTSKVENLPHLINSAGEIMKSVRELVKKSEKRERIKNEIEKLRDIQESLDKEMKGFDLNRLIYYIDRPDTKVDRLVDLYWRKFLAIFLEDYEKANSLKKEIMELERRLR